MPDLSSQLMIQTLTMVRSMEPYDTGNLRWNATGGVNLGGGSFDIYVDGNIAPYVGDLNTRYYKGLFSEDIPVAIQMLVDSNVNDRKETALASGAQIKDTVENNEARVALFNRSITKSNGGR